MTAAFPKRELTMTCRWPIDARLRHWHPVAPLARVTGKPLAVQCCGVPIALFKSGGGIAAVYDRCAHRRMPLSHGSVGPEGITCPYHGCRFSADGTGYCPTTRSNRFTVPVFETRTLHDVVWVRSRDAANGTSHDVTVDSGLHPALAEDDHAFACVVAKDIAAPLQLVVDNMTELEHTGLVHKKLAFGIDDFETVETRCQHDDDEVAIFYEGRQRPFPLYLSLLTGLRRGDVYVQTAHVSFTPPCAAYRLWWTIGKGGNSRSFGLRFVNYYTEVDATRTSLFSFVFWRTKGTLMHAIPRVSLPVFRAIVSAELERDKTVIEKMPQQEATLEWFQLNRFDKPLVATRRLMQRHYAPARDVIAITRHGDRAAGVPVTA
jgi:phenylpropionate dioxygenase-like ring-hydroxylating dioxygenase large terminal subunit